jgi:hypothetical protein
VIQLTIVKGRYNAVIRKTNRLGIAAFHTLGASASDT